MIKTNDREVTYVADQGRNLNTNGLALSDNDTTGLLNPSLTLLHDVPLAGVRVVLTSALGVLQRRELVLTADLNGSELVKGGQGEDVKDELLQLDTVGLLRLEGLAILRLDARNLLAGNVVRQLVRPGLDRLQETEGVVVVDDVGSAELQHIRLLGVLGLSSLLVNLRVLNDIRLAVLLQNQTNRLSGIAFPHHLSGNVDVLRGSETNEDRVCNLDQAVVNTVCVDVLDATVTHVLPHSRGDEGLVDTAISIWCDGSLYTKVIRTEVMVKLKESGTYLRLRLQQNLTLIGDTRQNTLLEDNHVVLGQSKVVVFLEEVFRRLASRSTGHHIPRNNRLLARDLLSQQLQFSNPLTLDLEKRLVARKTNVKATLGVRATQTSTLTTGHQNHRNFVLRNRLETCIVPLLDILGVRVEDRGQSHVGERLEGRRALGGSGRA